MGYSTPVEFLILIVGTSSIGTWWFGWPGGVGGFILGFYLFRKLQKRKNKNVDYDRIENLFKKYNRR